MAAMQISFFWFYLWVVSSLKVIAGNQSTLDFITVSIASCRASCLDEFVPSLPTIETCQSTSDCSMCLGVCPMLHKDLNMWGPMCKNQNICFPGCQKACDTIGHKKDIRLTSISTITVRSFYDPISHRVKLIWNPVTEGSSLNSTFYVVLLKNHTSESKTWTEFAQTTSCFIYLKVELLNRGTDMRIVATNASGQIADTVMTYYDTLSTEAIRPARIGEKTSEKDINDVLSYFR